MNDIKSGFEALTAKFEGVSEQIQP
jgi:hypothetical protein